MGGSSAPAPDDAARKILRAIDIRTGKIVWELPQTGPGTSRAGTLTTASGLVFFCEDTDYFMAADAGNGKPLWRFPTNNVMRGSPMTYVFDGRQHVAVASGANVISFALVDSSETARTTDTLRAAAEEEFLNPGSRTPRPVR
jgi:alcohol dehydrogenase (cytochrome c)